MMKLKCKFDHLRRDMRGFCLKLVRDVRGMSAIMITMSLIPTIGIIGVATDVSRAYIVKTRLRAALDAASLAGGKNFFETDRSAQIKKYFDANYPANFFGTTVTGPYELDANGNILPDNYVYSANDTILRLTADVTVPTTFMKLFDFTQMDLTADSEVTRETSLLDVVMAIDMSGSMKRSVTGSGYPSNSYYNRIETAKRAAVNLVDILFGADEENALLSVGLVPWSGKVNVTLNGSEYGKDAFGNTIPYASRFTTKVISGSPDNPYKDTFYKDDHNNLLLKNWTAKISKVYYAHNAPTVPLLAEPPTGWKGCVYARYARTKTWDVYQSYKDITAEGQAGDLVDGPYNPASGPAWVGWYPMGSEGETSSCSLRTLNQKTHSCTVCPTYGITPLQHTKTTLKDAINELSIPSGSFYTTISQGLAWAWRAITPGEPFDEATVVADPNYVKHKAIILLTDGQNTLRSGDAYNYGFYGTSKRNQRLKDLADRIKNLDDSDPDNDNEILIYTIQFANTSSSLVNLLKYVATDDDFYFYAPDDESLKAAFKKIAKDLSKLRLSK